MTQSGSRRATDSSPSLAGLRGNDFVSLELQDVPEPANHLALVFDDEDLLHIEFP